MALVRTERPYPDGGLLSTHFTALVEALVPLLLEGVIQKA